MLGRNEADLFLSFFLSCDPDNRGKGRWKGKRGGSDLSQDHVGEGAGEASAVLLEIQVLDNAVLENKRVPLGAGSAKGRNVNVHADGLGELGIGIGKHEDLDKQRQKKPVGDYQGLPRCKKKKKKKKKEKKAGADLVANSRGLAPSLGDEHVYE